MRIVSLFFASLILCGCGAASKKIDIGDIEASSAIKVVDLRPEIEKGDKTFSLFIGSEAYGIFRRGDKWIDPGAVRVLQHKIYENLPSAAVAPEIKVHHFVVYQNIKSQLRRGVFGGVLGGVLGGAIATATQKYGIDAITTLVTNEEFESFDAEYKRALYTQEENPNKVSVRVSYLDAEIDGKRTFVRTMTPEKLPKGDTRNPHHAAIETTIAFFLDQYP